MYKETQQSRGWMDPLYKKCILMENYLQDKVGQRDVW